jgi:hypothetical protein
MMKRESTGRLVPYGIVAPIGGSIEALRAAAGMGVVKR